MSFNHRREKKVIDADHIRRGLALARICLCRLRAAVYRHECLEVGDIRESRKS